MPLPFLVLFNQRKTHKHFPCRWYGPQHPSSIVKDKIGLNIVRSHVWRDVVFININGDAPEFSEVHADLIARWSEFDCPTYHGGTDSKFEMKLTANYKLAVENYCESYHLP